MKTQSERPISDEGLHRAANLGDIQNLKTILETGEINIDCQLDIGKRIWTPRNIFRYSKTKQEEKFTPINKEERDYLIPVNRGKRRPSSRQSNSPRLSWRGRSLLRKVPEEKCHEPEGSDCPEEDAISVAAKDGMSLTLQTLLEAGGDANVDSTDSEGFTPLMRCAARGHADCLQLLIDYGADIAARTSLGTSALHLAAANNHVDCLKKLLEAGAHVDSETKYGATALTMAAKEGNADCLRILIENQANVNTTYRNNQTSLLFAAEGGHEDCILLLLENGADIHKCNNQGVTPLMRAVQHNHDRCALTLLEHGSRVNDIDLKWRSPLHYAAESDNAKAIRYLLTYGADIHAETKGGNTALKYAVRTGHQECIKLLDKQLTQEKKREDRKVQKPVATTPGCLRKLLACSKPLITE